MTRTWDEGVLALYKRPVYAPFVCIDCPPYKEGGLHDSASNTLDSSSSIFYRTDFGFHGNPNHAYAFVDARQTCANSDIFYSCKIVVADYVEE